MKKKYQDTKTFMVRGEKVKLTIPTVKMMKAHQDEANKYIIANDTQSLNTLMLGVAAGKDFEWAENLPFTVFGELIAFVMGAE